MKVFYDTEFIEDGQTVDLISIGMVREDGREYYAVTNPDWRGWLGRIGENAWLMENVAPSLPIAVKPTPTQGGGNWNYVTWDKDHPDFRHVKSRKDIADEVRDFILAAPYPELWADWCAYDHVALCQLFGRMIDLPQRVPMWTHEFRQLVEHAGNPALPSLSGITEHNALDDARELKFRYEWLTAHHPDSAA